MSKLTLENSGTHRLTLRLLVRPPSAASIPTGRVPGGAWLERVRGGRIQRLETD